MIPLLEERDPGHGVEEAGKTSKEDPEPGEDTLKPGEGHSPKEGHPPEVGHHHLQQEAEGGEDQRLIDWSIYL